MDNLINILLQRNDSREDWGFHLTTDPENQLVIDRVKDGSLCSFYMSPGDSVLQVAGRSTKAMTTDKAYHLIKQAGDAVEIIIKKRPQGSSWSPVTPATPSFSPSKFTPGTQQSSWKPFPNSANAESDSDVIRGSVKPDPSGGYVHTFGTPKKESTPQTVTPNTPNSSWHNNNQIPYRQESVTSQIYNNQAPVQQESFISSPRYNNQTPFRQESVTSSPKYNNQTPFRQESVSSSPRYVQEIILPTGNQTNRSPARQTSYQNHPSHFSPVQQSPQIQNSASPVYYQTHNGDYANTPNGTPQRQVSFPYQTNRQESVPFQNSNYGAVPYHVETQSPLSNQMNSNSNAMNRQDSIPYQQPSRQTSWNQPSQQATSQYSSSPNVLSNQPVPVMYGEDSLSNSQNYSPSRQSSFNSPPVQVATGTFQPSAQNSVGGLFTHQNSMVSPTAPERNVTPATTPNVQRQSSVQYQSSPKPFTPNNYSAQPNLGATSPKVVSVPGPFARQQSLTGPQPWSPAPADSFPTPPPFSPSVESAGVPWPSSSELPTPPPPPPIPTQSPTILPPPPMNAPPPPPMNAPPPPPPPPPMPSSGGVTQEIPAWKKQIQATKEAKAAAGIPSQTPGTPSGVPELPAALAGSMKKDKKPFTYLPGGLDLSEIRSPKMQRRIIANQQQAPPPPSCMGQQVLLQPQQQSQQLPNQFDRLNLADDQGRMATAIESQRRASADSQDPRNYGQSRSFRLLQMMTGGDDETDSTPPQQAPTRKEEDEMRFTGLRRPDNPIPSRAFQTLQKMTSGADESQGALPQDARYKDESLQEQNQDGGPVDIRYKGGYIPGKSFKMLQEMTGDDGNPSGTVVPSVLQVKREQRKPPPHLHLSINQPQPPKQFPQPSVPASQQMTEEVPKMYTGGKIPSRSFRMLQAMTGENQGEDGTDM